MLEGDPDAIDQFRAHLPHVVILDVMMPGMNGYDVCAIIKNDDKHRAKVLMLTARGQHFDKAHGEMVGADHYMTKPVDTADVLAVVQHWLGLDS